MQTIKNTSLSNLGILLSAIMLQWEPYIICDSVITLFIQKPSPRTEQFPKRMLAVFFWKYKIMIIC